MNGKLVTRTKLSAVTLVALAIGASSADASNSQIVVTLSGMGIVKPVAKVDSISGGTTSGGNSVSTPTGVLTTATIKLPLVIKRSEPDRDLLKFAAVSIVNPNGYQTPALKSQTFDLVAPGQWKISHEQEYDKVVPTRVDIPGTFGPVAQHGSFVITANVLATHEITPSPAPPGPLPSTPHPMSAYPSYWVVRLAGFSTTLKEPPEGYFTFEPFSLSAQQTTLALTLHTNKVTATELTNWASAHPNGNATIEWTQLGSVGSTRFIQVSLKNASLSATSSDASTPAAITTHLTGTIAAIDAP